MRKKVIAGNWKMFKTVIETKQFFADFLNALNTDQKDVILFPTFTSLNEAVDAAKGSYVKIGAQNMHFEDSGAYTGEISAPMIKETGAQYVLIGHSERRKYFAETDETVNKKLRKALESDLLPVVCVGEDLTEREEGKTFEVLRRQIFDGLAELSGADIQDLIIAYEPVWAIGTGKTATDAQADEACAKIRDYLNELFGSAETVRILYGGSVNAGNIKALMSMPAIDGVLVGGASLKADFIDIVHYDR